MNFLKLSIFRKELLLSLPAVIGCKLAVSLAGQDLSAEGINYDLTQIEIPNPPSVTNFAGNSDSTDSFWATDNSGIYFFSYANNLDAPQLAENPEAFSMEHLYFWNMESKEIHRITSFEQSPVSGPFQQITELPDSGEILFSRSDLSNNDPNAVIFYHYNPIEQSTSVFRPADSDRTESPHQILGLGPVDHFLMANTYFSPGKSPNLKPDVLVPVFHNSEKNQWEESAPELFDLDFEQVIFHGFNATQTVFLAQVDARLYTDFKTEKGNYSNLWYNDGIGGPGQALDLTLSEFSSPQLRLAQSLDITGDRTTAWVIVRKSPRSGPFNLVKINLDSMTPVLADYELTDTLNLNSAIQVNYDGSLAFIADEREMRTAQVAEFVWLDIAIRQEKRINLNELFPDSNWYLEGFWSSSSDLLLRNVEGQMARWNPGVSGLTTLPPDENWRVQGFWGQTQDLLLKNSENQIARWNPEDQNVVLLSWSGEDFIYSISPDGNHVAIETFEALDPELDQNQMMDIYWIPTSPDSEGIPQPVLVSHGEQSAPAGLKTKLNSRYLTTPETILDTESERLVSGVPARWLDSETSQRLIPFFLNANNENPATTLGELLNLEADETIYSWNVSANSKLLACIIQSKTPEPGMQFLPRRMALVRLTGEGIEIWEPNEDEFPENPSIANALLFPPSIDPEGNRVFLLVRFSNFDVALCTLDISARSIQMINFPELLRSPDQFLNFNSHSHGPIVTQGGERIIIPQFNHFAFIDTTSHALIFDFNLNRYFSLNELDQDNVLPQQGNVLTMKQSHLSANGDYAFFNLYRVDFREFPNVRFDRLENLPNGLHFQNWTSDHSYKISNDGRRLLLVANIINEERDIPLIYNWDTNSYTFVGLAESEIENLIGTTTSIETSLSSIQSDSNLRYITLKYFVNHSDNGSQTQSQSQHTFIKNIETGSVVHLDIPDRQIIGQPVLSKEGSLALIKTHHGSPAFPETEFFLAQLSETIIEQEDSDQDGLPDAWETEHFQSLSADPQADPDQDGLTNRMEWVLGLDPLDSESSLRLMIERSAGLNEIWLKWKSGKTGQFSIETRSTDQNSGWNELSVPFTVYGDEAQVQLAPVESASSNLYRLKFSLD